MPAVQGRISLDGFEGYKLLSENEPLILETEDGRELPFFFQNSDGRIAARGSFKKRE
jgi:hypothetical protein